ncbi:RNA-binding S4 domain-containing protein [Gilvimarinus polysaccharolyticus]|uniref:RNA-binding S4 domain-containing protein n=1 Tax=Gilvimarinus polysaccharolyticus TaxID=863921 RepID=UPI0006734723|nr:RNA-binding S4 domain-containing protein [Gilvimarinus polysaccharolyticus]
MTDTFTLDGTEFITLANLLKVEGWVESGAMAKKVIDDGMVCVDGVTETRKRCKLVPGQRIEFNGNAIVINK